MAKHGQEALERCRRRVSKLMTVAAGEQKPQTGSREAQILQAIYDFYRDRRSRFELLASTGKPGTLSGFSLGLYFREDRSEFLVSLLKFLPLDLRKSRSNSRARVR